MRKLRRVVVVGSVGVVVLGGGAITTTVAAGATSCGTTLTWTGNKSQDFSDAQNWSPQQAPSSSSALVIADTATGAPQVQLNGSAQVCSITAGSAIDGGDLVVQSGATLTTSSIDIIGGPATNNYMTVEGNINAGSFEVSAGVTRYDTPDSNVTTSIAATNLTLDPNAQFLLSSSSSNVSVSGTATLGANAEFDSNSSDSAQLDLSGALKLAGNVNSTQLELHTTSAATIDLNGFTWQMRGDDYSVLATGTTITSSAPNGVLEVDNQGVLELDGTVTINSPATLEVANDSSGSPGTLSDSRVWTAANGAPTGGNEGTLTGTGTFLWNAGTVTGRVTLGPNLNVVAASSSNKVIAEQNSNYSAVLLNHSRHFQLTGGTLEEAGGGDHLDNNGTITESGGVLGQNSSDAPAIANNSTGVLAISGPVNKTIAWYGSSALANAGLVELGLGVHLTMNKFTQTSHGKIALLIKGRTIHSSLVTQAMSLNGKVALANAPGYSPSPPLTINKMLACPNGINGHAVVQSVTHKANLFWALTYTRGSGRQSGRPKLLNALLVKKGVSLNDSWSSPIS